VPKTTETRCRDGSVQARQVIERLHKQLHPYIFFLFLHPFTFVENVSYLLVYVFLYNSTQNVLASLVQNPTNTSVIRAAIATSPRWRYREKVGLKPRHQSLTKLHGRLSPSKKS